LKVVSEEDYQTWMQAKLAESGAPSFDANKSYSVAELVSAGEQVYNANCIACHQEGGVGMAPTFLRLKAEKLRPVIWRVI
jgi:cytochrome c oxidase subunit 2